MKQGIKIVSIGGGSSYTPELMEGFALRLSKSGVNPLGYKPPFLPKFRRKNSKR